MLKALFPVTGLLVDGELANCLDGKVDLKREHKQTQNVTRNLPLDKMGIKNETSITYCLIFPPLQVGCGGGL